MYRHWWLRTWVGLTLISMFHHFAQLLCPFCLYLISPSRIRQTVELPKSKSLALTRVVADLGWVDFDFYVPSSCLAALPVLLNSQLPQQKWQTTQPRSAINSVTLYKVWFTRPDSAPLSAQIWLSIGWADTLCCGPGGLITKQTRWKTFYPLLPNQSTAKWNKIPCTNCTDAFAILYISGTHKWTIKGKRLREYWLSLGWAHHETSGAGAR